MLSVIIKKKIGSFRLNITLEAADGITGILGASGCGKSMTLRCIAGIDRPDEGRIILDGVTLFDSEKRINVPPEKRKVGYLFQHYALFPNMTVEQNILCGLYGQKDKNKRAAALAEAVHLLALEGLEKRRPAELSGGQQQRAALARILVNRPRLLMLDEPFSALDTHLRGQLQIRLGRLRRQYGGPVLMVTHDHGEAFNLCGQIAVMDDGVFLSVKRPPDLFADPGSAAAAVITGCENIAAAEKTGEHEAYVPRWGIRLKTTLPLRGGLRAVGIRSRNFDPEIADNNFPVRFTGVTEHFFECSFQFRYENQAAEEPDLRRLVSKEKKPSAGPLRLGVAPENVLPLY